MTPPRGFHLKQGIGLLLLLLLVGGLRLFIYLLPSPAAEDIAFADSVSVATAPPKDTLLLQPFDPNTADSLTLRQLGLKAWQISNLLHYRQRGGRFKSKQDFRRLYGLTDSAYQALLPYIAIDTMPFFYTRQERLWRDSLRRDSLQKAYEARRDSLQNAYQQRRDSLFAAGRIHEKKDTLIELNTADTNSLQYIKGIGSYTARRIVRYREQLGGYYSPEQVREIDLHYEVSWDSILPHLTADTTLITPIFLQSASVEKLTQHPYISFTQAKALYELRRRKVRLSGMADLYPAIFNEQEARHLRPYLHFTDEHDKK